RQAEREDRVDRRTTVASLLDAQSASLANRFTGSIGSGHRGAARLPELCPPDVLADRLVPYAGGLVSAVGRSPSCHECPVPDEFLAVPVTPESDLDEAREFTMYIVQLPERFQHRHSGPVEQGLEVSVPHPRPRHWRLSRRRRHLMNDRGEGEVPTSSEVPEVGGGRPGQIQAACSGLSSRSWRSAGCSGPCSRTPGRGGSA